MIQATLAREALSSHKALMAATTWSKAEEIKPMMVIILKLKNAKNRLLVHSLR
jgi:hypothetical protein